MSEPIFEPSYWEERLARAIGGDLHHAVFVCQKQRWEIIAEKHRELLTRYVNPDDAILDVGCGWGRILGLMPDSWHGEYTGIDLCGGFITQAKRDHPEHRFYACDVRKVNVTPTYKSHFDLAIMVSVRPMIRRNVGEDAWGEVLRSVEDMADRILYLEYDPNDEGSLE